MGKHNHRSQYTAVWGYKTPQLHIEWDRASKIKRSDLGVEPVENKKPAPFDLFPHQPASLHRIAPRKDSTPKHIRPHLPGSHSPDLRTCPPLARWN